MGLQRKRYSSILESIHDTTLQNTAMSTLNPKESNAFFLEFCFLIKYAYNSFDFA